MADIKTHLRELSVAATIGLLSKHSPVTQEDLYDGRNFFHLAESVVTNSIASAQNLRTYTRFPQQLRDIVDNGWRLGLAICQNPHFSISAEDTIFWLGNDTQKSDPIDIQVGDYGFSLKEDSYIIKNMGLYQFLHHLTGDTYPRGLHIFEAFAPDEYAAWFQHTWQQLLIYLAENKTWTLNHNKKESRIALQGQSVRFSWNSKAKTVPSDLLTARDFAHYTTAAIRENVFAKWISQTRRYDPDYWKLKRRCSVQAGEQLVHKINSEYTPQNVYDFFQIQEQTYYYGKTTSAGTTILKVPGKSDFHASIQFLGSHYEVPNSQLNIITEFQNQNTGRTLRFRNECRFSHGQFNGTPEAKMYVDKHTSLDDLYDPI